VPDGCRGRTGTTRGQNVGGDRGNMGVSYADRTRWRLAPDFSRETDALYREVRKRRDERGDAIERACRDEREDLTRQTGDGGLELEMVQRADDPLPAARTVDVPATASHRRAV